RGGHGGGRLPRPHPEGAGTRDPRGGLVSSTTRPTTATNGGSYSGGSGTPLVLLHGVGGNWRVWTPSLPLVEGRHAVHALTRPRPARMGAGVATGHPGAGSRPCAPRGTGRLHPHQCRRRGGGAPVAHHRPPVVRDPAREPGVSGPGRVGGEGPDHPVRPLRRAAHGAPARGRTGPAARHLPRADVGRPQGGRPSDPRGDGRLRRSGASPASPRISHGVRVMSQIAATLDEIRNGPAGPEIGAFFDFDG